jgi:hypothetical protein
VTWSPAAMKWIALTGFLLNNDREAHMDLAVVEVVS